MHKVGISSRALKPLPQRRLPPALPLSSLVPEQVSSTQTTNRDGEVSSEPTSPASSLAVSSTLSSAGSSFGETEDEDQEAILVSRRLAPIRVQGWIHFRQYRGDDDGREPLPSPIDSWTKISPLSAKTTVTKTSFQPPGPSTAADPVGPAAKPASALSRSGRLEPDLSVDNALESDVSTLIEDEDKSDVSQGSYVEDVLGYADAFVDPLLSKAVLPSPSKIGRKEPFAPKPWLAAHELIHHAIERMDFPEPPSTPPLSKATLPKVKPKSPFVVKPWLKDHEAMVLAIDQMNYAEAPTGPPLSRAILPQVKPRPPFQVKPWLKAHESIVHAIDCLAYAEAPTGPPLSTAVLPKAKTKPPFKVKPWLKAHESLCHALDRWDFAEAPTTPPLSKANLPKVKPKPPFKIKPWLNAHESLVVAVDQMSYAEPYHGPPLSRAVLPKVKSQPPFKIKPWLKSHEPIIHALERMDLAEYFDGPALSKATLPKVKRKPIPTPKMWLKSNEYLLQAMEVFDYAEAYPGPTLSAPRIPYIEKRKPSRSKPWLLNQPSEPVWPHPWLHLWVQDVVSPEPEPSPVGTPIYPPVRTRSKKHVPFIYIPITAEATPYSSVPGTPTRAATKTAIKAYTPKAFAQAFAKAGLKLKDGQVAKEGFSPETSPAPWIKPASRSWPSGSDEEPVANPSARPARSSPLVVPRELAQDKPEVRFVPPSPQIGKPRPWPPAQNDAVAGPSSSRASGSAARSDARDPEYKAEDKADSDAPMNENELEASKAPTKLLTSVEKDSTKPPSGPSAAAALPDIDTGENPAQQPDLAPWSKLNSALRQVGRAARPPLVDEHPEPLVTAAAKTSLSGGYLDEVATSSGALPLAVASAAPGTGRVVAGTSVGTTVAILDAALRQISRGPRQHRAAGSDEVAWPDEPQSQANASSSPPENILAAGATATIQPSGLLFAAHKPAVENAAGAAQPINGIPVDAGPVGNTVVTQKEMDPAVAMLDAALRQIGRRQLRSPPRLSVTPATHNPVLTKAAANFNTELQQIGRPSRRPLRPAPESASRAAVGVASQISNDVGTAVAALDAALRQIGGRSRPQTSNDEDAHIFAEPTPTTGPNTPTAAEPITKLVVIEPIEKLIDLKPIIPVVELAVPAVNELAVSDVTEPINPEVVRHIAKLNVALRQVGRPPKREPANGAAAALGPQFEVSLLKRSLAATTAEPPLVTAAELAMEEVPVVSGTGSIANLDATLRRVGRPRQEATTEQDSADHESPPETFVPEPPAAACLPGPVPEPAIAVPPYETPAQKVTAALIPSEVSPIVKVPVVIDYLTYPDIMERILGHAAHRTLLSFRGTTRVLKQQVDDMISSHLVISEAKAGKGIQLEYRAPQGGVHLLPATKSWLEDVYIPETVPKGHVGSALQGNAGASAAQYRVRILPMMPSAGSDVGSVGGSLASTRPSSPTGGPSAPASSPLSAAAKAKAKKKKAKAKAKGKTIVTSLPTVSIPPVLPGARTLDIIGPVCVAGIAQVLATAPNILMTRYLGSPSGISAVATGTKMIQVLPSAMCTSSTSMVTLSEGSQRVELVLGSDATVPELPDLPDSVRDIVLRFPSPDEDVIDGLFSQEAVRKPGILAPLVPTLACSVKSSQFRYTRLPRTLLVGASELPPELFGLGAAEAMGAAKGSATEGGLAEKIRATLGEAIERALRDSKSRANVRIRPMRALAPRELGIAREALKVNLLVLTEEEYQLCA